MTDSNETQPDEVPKEQKGKEEEEQTDSNSPPPEPEPESDSDSESDEEEDLPPPPPKPRKKARKKRRYVAKKRDTSGYSSDEEEVERGVRVTKHSNSDSNSFWSSGLFRFITAIGTAVALIGTGIVFAISESIDFRGMRRQVSNTEQAPPRSPSPPVPQNPAPPPTPPHLLPGGVKRYGRSHRR